MNTVLSFMDKLYSDSKTLSIVYVVGAILLFVFIILLMVSLRKSDKKETTKIIEEPKIDEPKEKIEETKVESKEILKEEPTINNESINNKIKTLRRQAYGYPDDEYFFLKLFYMSRH